jgi:hypothetical protein
MAIIYPRGSELLDRFFFFAKLQFPGLAPSVRGAARYVGGALFTETTTLIVELPAILFIFPETKMVNVSVPV